MRPRRLRLLLAALATFWVAASVVLFSRDNATAALAGLAFAVGCGIGWFLSRSGEHRADSASHGPQRRDTIKERREAGRPGLGFSNQDRNTHKMAVGGMTFALVVIVICSIGVLLTPGVTAGQRTVTLVIAGAMGSLAAGFLAHSIRKLRS